MVADPELELPLFDDPEIGADLEGEPEEVVATVLPNPRKIDEQMSQYCKDYHGQKSEVLRQRVLGDIYALVSNISRNMVVKKFGAAGRINLKEVTHEVATSIIMNVVVKDRDVQSWAKLLKKCSIDLTNRWMLKHLYGKHSNDRSLSMEGEDGDESSTEFDVPYNQLGGEELLFLEQYVEKCAERIYRIMRQYRAPQGIFAVRMAMSRALGNESIFYLRLPQRKRLVINYLESEFRAGLAMATCRDTFERALLAGVAGRRDQ